MDTKLGKIKKVPLREIWKNEAYDFTTWLAKDTNLKLLSDAVGIDIELIQTEAPTGKYNVDILAEEPSSKNKIIIENQLEVTDHNHLGKLITYASGHDAKYIIWIVRSFTEEHKQAITWLNENTNQEVNIFIIKMELWKIDDSRAAPKFNVIVSPNEWAKTIKSLKSNSSLTETKLLQLDFWSKFNEFFEDKRSLLSLRKPQPQHWYDLSFGYSQDANISLTVDTKKKIIGCQLYIHSKRAKEIFHKLQEYTKDIESELKVNLDWQELPERKASRLIVTVPGDINKTDDWTSYFEWLKNTAEKFYHVFGNYFKKIGI